MPFIRASLASGLIAGFGLGLLIFASSLIGRSPGLWIPAATQAHGHVQLFGWAGLMVLGVGLHFLPRLASAPPIPPAPIRRAFWLIVAGLISRVAGQIGVALADGDVLRLAFRIVWPLGAALELLGIVLVGITVGRALQGTRPFKPNAAIQQVLPFLVVAFLGLIAAAGGSALAAVKTGFDDLNLIRHQTSTDLAVITFYAFLTPISVAMSARVFPLFLRTRTPRIRLLRAGLILLLAGLALRLAGNLQSATAVEQFGRLLLALAPVAFVVGSGIFEPRRQLPRRRVRIWRDATGLHAVSAYFWLLAAGYVQLQGTTHLDTELHLLGLGFVTMLILGVGVHLLPGFARRPMRGSAYVWSTLVLGNLATILRIIPTISELPTSTTTDRYLGTLAGIAGMAALSCFAVNLSALLLNGRR